MNAKKNEDGKLSVSQQNQRFLNVLQLLYMSAQKDKHSNNHYIPSSIMDMVETELDFNSTESLKKDIVEQCKKKYRKRKSYLMWSEILQKGNYSNYKDAKDVLMMVHDTQQYRYQSITQERYAMDTLILALDDYFGTNKVKIQPSPYLYKPRVRKPKPSKAKALLPNKKGKRKSKTKKTSPFDQVPF